MADYTDTLDAGTVEEDIAQQAAARELRIQMLQDRQRQTATAARTAATGAAGEAEQAMELVNKYRQFRTWLAAGEILSAGTVLLWFLITLPLLNIQLLWTALSLPGYKFFGIPPNALPFVIPIVLAGDALAVLAVILLAVLAYAYTHPTEAAFTAFTNFPSAAWEIIKLILPGS